MATKIKTYNDGEGVTTVAWMDADFNPVEAGSDDARYVKMIASTGEMSFYRVAEEDRRDLGGPGSGNFGHSGRPGEVGGSSSEGGSPKEKEESRSKLSSGKVHGRELITGSVNHVERISLVPEGGHPVNDAVEAIFKPESGESWTGQDVAEKEIVAYKEENGVGTETIDQMIEDGELGGGDPDEPVRETIVNRDFSYADREAAAYEIDETLGLNVIPPTIVREIEGKRGMVQQFVETDGLGLHDARIDQDSVYGIAVLDVAIGNTDRHEGNILIDKDRRVVAIDQGLSFPDDTDWHENYQFRPDATMSLLAVNTKPMSGAMAERISKNLLKTDWEATSKKWPMSAGERDRFLTRMDYLKTAFADSDPVEASRGIRSLISTMASESNIASGHVRERIVHVDTGHIQTRISE